MTAQKHTPIILTIAGSDSGGGAGIQADIKAISATGGYACSVITALTAQNTQGVTGIYPIDVSFIEQQLDSVFSDLDIQAVKVGMLSDANVIHSVAKKIRQYKPRFLVVDPVMVATSGDILLEESAISTLKSQLLPLADIITPNLPEAAALTDSPVPETEEEMRSLVDKLQSLETSSVLLKGGHLEQEATSMDLLINHVQTVTFSTQRVATKNTHGTGCTLSSAVASYLAQEYPLEETVRLAKEYITHAISHADELKIGKGRGPVNHFFAGHDCLPERDESIT